MISARISTTTLTKFCFCHVLRGSKNLEHVSDIMRAYHIAVHAVSISRAILKRESDTTLNFQNENLTTVLILQTRN
jgi:hypothetical protein